MKGNFMPNKKKGKGKGVITVRFGISSYTAADLQQMEQNQTSFNKGYVKGNTHS